MTHPTIKAVLKECKRIDKKMKFGDWPSGLHKSFGSREPSKCFGQLAAAKYPGWEGATTSLNDDGSYTMRLGGATARIYPEGNKGTL